MAEETTLTKVLDGYVTTSVQESTARFFGKSGRQDVPASKLKPTSGKLHDEAEKRSRDFEELKKLRGEERGVSYTHLKKLEEYCVWFDKPNYAFKADAFTPEQKAEDRQRAEAGIDAFFMIDNRIAKVLDPTELTAYSLDQYDDYIANVRCDAILKPILTDYFADMKKIAKKVEPIKKKVLDEDTLQTVTPVAPALKPTAPDQPDKDPTIPARTLDQWVYDFEMYYIRPDNQVVRVDQYIDELVYNMEFDIFVMPIYSVHMIVTPDVYRDFKENFEQLRWYLSVKKYVKPTTKDGYTLKHSILENHSMVALNPDLPTDGTTTDGPLSGVPSLPVKLDLVSKRNIDLNGKMRSKVFNNVTLLDVITALLTESYNDQVKADASESDLVTLNITPPDNTRTYEQIILDPGNVSQNLKQLQEKYGVYQTGLRCMFDTVSYVPKADGKEFTNRTTITVTDKSGNAPSPKQLEQVMIEILDRNTRQTPGEYESGMRMDAKNNIAIVRTMEAYQIDKRNAAKIIDGDSVRVISSSQDDTVDSECDINPDLESPQRTYWGKNSNPYNLTQLQDTTREKLLSIAVQASNVNAYMFNKNLRYVLKFYNRDDEAYSGEYRIKALQFRFKTEGKLAVKEGVPVASFFYFTNIPNIMINGASMKKETYSEKVQRMKNDYAAFKGKGTVSNPTLASGPPLIRAPKRGGPFLPSFDGNNDYLGKEVPKEIKPDYPMSKHVKFVDVYTTADGTYPERGNAMCQELDLFNFCQKFSSKILDPIFDKYGKCVGAGGKLNSFFRYHVPAGGSSKSSHMWAMAADLLLTAGGGDSLCEPFWWIATQSGLDFDQVILEGNGSEWRWIHVGARYNGTNRRQVLLINNSKGGQYIQANLSLFTSPDKAKFADFMKKIR
jgi:hypothetical protein